MEYLNLACGDRFHEDWVNIDFNSSSQFVEEYNLLIGIPYDNDTFDVVYSSHVLGHFTREQAKRFLNECFRVLKKGGIIRLVVPDFEQLAVEYLIALSEVSKTENDKNSANYDWAVIEMIDEMVRDRAGGEMLQFWQQKKIVNEQKIIERVGYEFIKIRNNIVLNNSHELSKSLPTKKTIKTRIKFFLLKKLNISPSELEQLRFRQSGELFKWVYDRFSLKRILLEHGFVDAKIRTAFESGIHDWEKYCTLDIENGKVRKPDSLFMEARK